MGAARPLTPPRLLVPNPTHVSLWPHFNARTRHSSHPPHTRVCSPREQAVPGMQPRSVGMGAAVWGGPGEGGVHGGARWLKGLKVLGDVVQACGSCGRGGGGLWRPLLRPPPARRSKPCCPLCLPLFPAADVAQGVTAGWLSLPWGPHVPPVLADLARVRRGGRGRQRTAIFTAQ